MKSSAATRKWIIVPRIESWYLARVAWVAGALAVAGCFVWLTLLCAPFTIDDAFISLRYSENLVRGYGLVYNPGEQVEGYTNFLWVIVIAGVYALGGDSLAASKVLGALANAATLGILAFAAWRLLRPSPLPGLALLAPALLVVNYGFILWGVGGLETSLFTCLATAGLLLVVRQADAATEDNYELRITNYELESTRHASLVTRYAVVRRLPWAAMLFGLAVLTRPDATVLFAGGMIGWLAFHFVRGSADLGFLQSIRNPKSAIQNRWWRVWLAEAAVVGLVLLAHTLFRYLYYGDWVPNTAYLKMAPENAFAPHWKGLLDWLSSWQLVKPENLAAITGLATESDFVRVPLALLANPAVWLALAGLWTWRRRSQAWVLGLACAAWLLYLWRIYDDWMPGWRYYVPILPAIVLLVVGGLGSTLAAANRLRGSLPRALSKVVLPAMVLALIFTSLNEFRNRQWEVQAIARIVETYRRAALYLREHTLPTEVLVMGDAGAVPYYSGLFTVDYAGLADKHMARVPLRPATIDKGDDVVRHYERMRYDTDYLLSRNPSFVQLTGRLMPEGGFRAHYPEAVLVYQALQRDGRYDLANPVIYDEPTQLIIVKRNDAVWNP